MRCLYLLLISCLLVGCGASPEQQAAESAKAYYDLLAEGDGVSFLEGKAGADTLSADYGDSLLEAICQYQRDIEKKHGGLRQVDISDNPGQRDTLGGIPMIHAFLILSYADSTQEEIMVSMVEHDGRWLMK